MNRAIKCRIYPNKEQRVLLEKTFGCCRFLYNRMLTDRLTGEYMGEAARPVEREAPTSRRQPKWWEYVTEKDAGR